MSHVLNQSKILTFSFVEPFVDNLINYIDGHYIQKGQDLNRLAIVFGGKRPALFIKRELAKRLGANFYPPKFFTIDEFMGYVVRKHELFTSTRDLDSCYLIYQLADKHCPEILRGRADFAQFLPWTREILAFIDQLDLEHVSNEQLRNVESNAQIGFDVPKDINRLLENIVVLRDVYHAALADQKIYSRGLQYFRAAEVACDVSFDEFDQILFCNFFYFNKAEEIVVEGLFKKDLVTMIFQGDERKWPVLTRIAKKFECRIEEGKEPDLTKFDLKLYSGFDAHSQVGIVREILKNIENKEKAVIVLPNPDHIIPLISEVSQTTQEFNISMGYPLKRSSLYSLFDFIFKAQLSRQGKRYYARDYLKAISHPFIKNLKLTEDEHVMRTVIHALEDVLTGRERVEISGSLFIALGDIEGCDHIFEVAAQSLSVMDITVDPDNLKGLLSNVHRLLFEPWEDVLTFENFGGALGEVIDVLVAKSFMDRYPLNMNIATKMYALRDEFITASFAKEEFKLDEMVRIFDGKVSRELVAFIGSPLKGLQILGLFETRSLNFEHVIMLDVNEGSLPNLRIYEPLIPREVMISLNLDRLELEEEIQRYQFMRLISSAKNVHLVYQESKDKERSRFVEELVWEQQKCVGMKDTIRPKQASFAVKVGVNERRVKKTPAMIETLKGHRFSASSLGMYMRNPMDFYYSYVLGLREKEDLLDEPEAWHIGIFVHDLLEAAFRPFLNKKPVINQDFRKNFQKLFEEKFAQTFGKSMRGDSFLLNAVLQERLKRFLDNEAENRERKIKAILYLEERFEEVIELSCGNISFGYIVDRVDRLYDDTVMIIDYKAGSIDVMPKDIAAIESMVLSRETIRDTVKFFQVPLYYHYLNKKFSGQNINAALYNLRTLELNKFIDKSMNYERDQINNAFKRALDFILTEILNPDIDFVEDLSFNK